jgi:signal transduction histidine kinase/ligand-binding sensor domain-containing protein
MYLWFVICCINLSPIQAQVQPGSARLHFESVSEKIGIGTLDARCFLKDHHGFLWVGTVSGLYRLDGFEYNAFLPDLYDTNTISTAFICSLHEDKAGNIWIGTFSAGLDIYHPDSGIFTHYRSHKDIPLGTILKIDTDKNNTTWISVSGSQGGICRYDAQQDTFICYRPTSFIDTSSFDDLGNQVETFVFLKDGSIILGSIRGLISFDPYEPSMRWMKMDGKWDQNNNQAVNDIYPENDSLLWLGVWGHGIRRYNLRTEKFDQYDFAKGGSVTGNHNIAYRLAPKSDHELWIASPDAGLLLFDTDTKVFDDLTFLKKGVEPGHRMQGYAVYKDVDDFSWIGTMQGFWQYDPTTQYAPNTTLISSRFDAGIEQAISSVCEIDGRLYITTNYGDGITVLDTNLQWIKIIPYRERDHYAHFFGILADQHHRLWCYNGKLIFEIKDDQLIPVYPEPVDKSYGKTGIRFVREDKNGNLILITSNGYVMIFNPDSRTIISEHQMHLPEKENMNNVYLRDFQIDQHGNKWALFNYSCVAMDSSWHFLREIPFKINDKMILGAGMFYHMQVDLQQRVWFSSVDGALSCFDPARNSVININVRSGLPSNDIIDLACDSTGTIWVSTSNGLVTIQADSFKITVMNSSTGLEHFFNNNLNMGSHGNVYLNDGIWLTKINKYKTQWPHPQPEVRLTAIHTRKQVFSELQANQIQQLTLSHNNNSITFYFSSIALQGASFYQFAYRLLPEQAVWTKANPGRSVSFANLNDGHYRFEVRAAGPDNKWGQIKSMELIISPTFFKTGWFYLLAFGIIAGSIYIIYRYRLKKALELYKLRSGISRDLHDEVGSTLGSISLLNEMARRKLIVLEGPDELHTKISHNLQKAMEAMDDIIWSINPRNDELDNLALRLGEVASLMLEPAEILYDLVIDEHLSGLRLTMDRRRNVYLIYKEALYNIVKYAKCQRVTIRFEVKNKTLHLTIHDDGIGFHGVDRSGNGLFNMKERAAAAGGEISIETLKNEGTSVFLSVPIV